MPLHAIQHLAPTAVLGLWHLTESPEELWPLLPQASTYPNLIPASADAARQAQWLAGRVLVHALAQGAAWLGPQPFTVYNDATGRPWLAHGAPGLAVSLSHSGQWVAALLAHEARVGIDVEMVRDKAQRLAAKFLAPHEWAAAQALAQAHPAAASAHYSLLWSAKETLYKLAAQRGLIFKQQLLLGAFSPAPAGTIPGTLRLSGAETRHCICYYEPAPGYVLTYCHEPGV